MKLWYCRHPSCMKSSSKASNRTRHEKQCPRKSDVMVNVRKRWAQPIFDEGMYKCPQSPVTSKIRKMLIDTFKMVSAKKDKGNETTCPYCFKSFTRKYHCKRHIQLSHTEVVEPSDMEEIIPSFYLMTLMLW